MLQPGQRLPPLFQGWHLLNRFRDCLAGGNDVANETDGLYDGGQFFEQRRVWIGLIVLLTTNRPRCDEPACFESHQFPVRGASARSNIETNIP